MRRYINRAKLPIGSVNHSLAFYHNYNNYLQLTTVKSSPSLTMHQTVEIVNICINTLKTRLTSERFNVKHVRTINTTSSRESYTDVANCFEKCLRKKSDVVGCFASSYVIQIGNRLDVLGYRNII